MIQSVDRALQILEYIAENHGMGISTLAQLMDIDKSSVSRLICTLRAHNLVRLDPNNGKYYLGYRILFFSSAIKNEINIVAIANPIIHRLSQELGESIHLCALANDMAFVVDQVKGHYIHNIATTIGALEPFHCSSVGKCILAYQQDKKIEKMLMDYEYKKFTENTIISKEGLLEEIQKIRKQGYAIDMEEMTHGVCCFAVPIYDYKGEVKYSIGLSGLRSIIGNEDFNGNLQAMKAAAHEISVQLGFRDA